jgi:predicted MFS family arabinose efflux permease
MLFASVPLLALGGLVNGIGMGLFWVGTQGILALVAGGVGSERAFVRQYVFYILGSAAGASLTGLATAALRALGVEPALSIRLTLGIGMVSATVGLALWLPFRHTTGRTETIAVRASRLPLLGLALQVPDLLLVLGASLLLNLAPVLLKHTFKLSPVAIGGVIGAIALAKISGSLAAGRAVRAHGSRRAIFAMLATAALSTLALGVAHVASVFIPLLLITTMLAIGAWPVVVDAALARVRPEHRPGFAVVWNVREYAVIALATALSGWLLDTFDTPTVLVLVAALALTAAAGTATRALREPVHVPTPRNP